jgi:hypothetical protein
MTKRKVPNVVRGGKAIPLKGKTNYYYMQGRKHSSGGIDIGENPRTGLEVEDGEVMHVADKEIKVFSSVPFLNGESPAQKVMGGENPTKVFNQQEEFKDKHNMNDDGTKKKKRMGGLSRKKDYGSKSKPYPKVKAGDFAGGGRSYPIPTKADAVDALRLAGLHGRSDVKAKVYSKYPELRKKSKAGGLYSVTVGGRTKLRMFPSTWESAARSAAVRAKKVTGGTKGINPDLVEEEDTYDYNTNATDSTISTNTTNDTDKKKKDTDKKKKDKKKSFLRNIGKYIEDNSETITDAIGLTSNVAGGLISHDMNRSMLNKLKYNSQPIARQTTKLKTRININPQLDKMRESLAAYERDVDTNTASSRVALARKQRARLANMLQTNELFGNKENIETELINKDRLNQQTVTDANIRDYNTWSEKKAAFENAISEKKAENDVSLINILNAGVQDVIGRREKRKSERQTRLAMAAANPNVNPRILRDLGIKGITDADIDRWEKAFAKKKEER